MPASPAQELLNENRVGRLPSLMAKLLRAGRFSRDVRRAVWFAALALSSTCASAAPAIVEASAPVQSGVAVSAPAPVVQASVSPLDWSEAVRWLVAAHDASKKRNYTGTFVVLAASGAMSSSRIWHAAAGDQQVERIETLSGSPRSTFRRNDQITTFFPDQHLARTELRPSYGLFPHLLAVGVQAVGANYEARRGASERVAGIDTEVIELLPRDALRYGYRMWTDKRTGFAVRLQTIDRSGHVLEQAAFSDLDLDPSLQIDKLVRMMGDTAGYRVEKQSSEPISAKEEGWAMEAPLAGFQPIGAYRRSTLTPAAPMQWIFSDGLATVSLFLEPYGARRRVPWHMANGITHMLAQRQGQDWWVTAVGEVPLETLKLFASRLERLH